MEIGFVILPTDRSMRFDDLAVEVEARGFGVLMAVGDHTHIPARRTTPFPSGGGMFYEHGDTMPEPFRRTFDFLVAAAAAAARTSTLLIGSAVFLVAQRDPIATAKQVASVDAIAGGRFLFGVGYGWNVEEAADHGVEWSTRRGRAREYVLAMRQLWEHDEATFHGRFVDFDRAWMWPKPVSRPSVPVLLGAAPSTRTYAALCELADGWLPVPDLGHRPTDVLHMRAYAEAHGRDPGSLAVHVDGLDVGDREGFEAWHSVGAASALIPLPSAGRDEVLPVLDRALPLLARYADH